MLAPLLPVRTTPPTARAIPTIIRVIAEQERAEVGTRSLGFGPADDDEFLAIKAFGLAPETPVARRIGCIDRLGDDAFEPEFASMFADQLAVAHLVIVELKAGNALDQGFEKRLALDERQAGGVPAIKMQKIEDVVNESHAARAIARGLGL